MSPQEMRLLSSEELRSKIKEFKQTAQLLDTSPAEGHQLVDVVKARAAKTIAEMEDILFSRG
jgi:predicted regulator of amino acid metabolism with ACT domain